MPEVDILATVPRVVQVSKNPIEITKAIVWAQNKCAEDGLYYSQQIRWGPKSYDCSSFVISCWKVGAGMDTKGARTTVNIKREFSKIGFVDVTHLIDIKTGKGLKAGDVINYNDKAHPEGGMYGHAMFYIGEGLIAEAGGRTRPAKQGGPRIGPYYNGGWNEILRYTAGKPVVNREPNEVDRALDWIIETAKEDKHGYSQKDRWGPDYDCSSLVFEAWNRAGVPVIAYDNGRKAGACSFLPIRFLVNGFTDVAPLVSSSNDLIPGDVLLKTNTHAAMYVGGGLIVHAAGDYDGKPGDSTGKEITSDQYKNFDGYFDRIFRYKVPPNTYAYSASALAKTNPQLASDLAEQSTSSSTSSVQSELDSGISSAFSEISSFFKSLTSSDSSSDKMDSTKKESEFSSYKEYVQSQRAKRSGGAVEEGEPVTRLVTTIGETPDVISNQGGANLLSSESLVETPFVIVQVGNFSFGKYVRSSSGGAMNVQYPNYIDSLNVVKVNGTVNQYTIVLTYQIEAGQDPNLLDKIFSSVGYGKVYISYGDYSSPAFIYKSEEAIITNLSSRIDFVNSRIVYTLSCTSNALALAANSFTFDACRAKPSDKIIEILTSEKYGLKDIFTGMNNETFIRQCIAGNDVEVDLEPKVGMDPLSYINYLVSCMSPNAERNTSIGNSTYYLTIVDDNDGNHGGPYFKVTEISATEGTSLADSGVYNITVGYSGYKYDNASTMVMSFEVENDSSWALLYNYAQDIRTENYVYNIDNNGNIVTEYSPNIMTSSRMHRTTDAQKTWWTQMTQFPITATLQIKGLLRPAMLMSYIRINSLFYGQRHISSGLYVVTKQQDTIDRNGFRTTLTLLRVTGDNSLSLSARATSDTGANNVSGSRPPNSTTGGTTVNDAGFSGISGTF